MNDKELVYFTGKCLNLDKLPDFRERIIRLALENKVPWENLVWLWDKSMILPTLTIKIFENGLLPFLPEELALHLHQICRMNRERNERLLRQADSITSELNKAGICPVFLKGMAHLMDNLYSDPGERIIGDIDLLVPEEKFLESAEILRMMGYTTWQKVYGDIHYQMHYPILLSEGEPAGVEIHRIPVTISRLSAFTAEMIFASQKTVPDHPGCYVPSDEHKLIHTFLHGEIMNHGHCYHQISFRGLYDLLLLSERTDAGAIPLKTGYPRKAVSWLVLAGRLVGSPGRFYPEEYSYARRYCYMYGLSLSFPVIHQTWVFLAKLMHLLFTRYAGLLFKAVVSKSHRQSIIQRLKDPGWYREHFKSLFR